MAEKKVMRLDHPTFFYVTDAEFVSKARFVEHPPQVMLSVLKDKGAPVDGVMWLKANMKDYLWERWYEPEKRQTAFLVRPILEIKEEDLEKLDG